MVGAGSSDDAGVYRLSDEVALIQTVDFITPLVDDPYSYGRIAACNSLSDVYAMGGTPLTALNIVAFPVNKYSLDRLENILEGGLSVLKETGTQLLGGHSIDDNELKYGLSVTGTVHPDGVIPNNTIREGDTVILTKALGTGIIATAVKAEMASEDVVKTFVESMTTLNDFLPELAERFTVHACTDVTGFGLVGHLVEMLGDSSLQIILDSENIPLLPGAVDLAREGLVPGGLYRNRDFSGPRYDIRDSVDPDTADLIFDPQTSGGLLISVPEKESGRILSWLHERGHRVSSGIGRVAKGKPGTVVLG